MASFCRNHLASYTVEGSARLKVRNKVTGFFIAEITLLPEPKRRSSKRFCIWQVVADAFVVGLPEVVETVGLGERVEGLAL